MTPDDLRELCGRSAWGKHIVLWVGRRAKLEALLDGKPVVWLDLLDLFDEDEPLPAEDEDRRGEIEGRLADRLPALRPSGNGRCILCVSNAAILARWKVNLEAFFDFFGGSRTMVVLTLDGTFPAGRWQTHLEQQLEYRPDGTRRYLTSCLADSALVYSEHD
jgi:hypothetical protein